MFNDVAKDKTLNKKFLCDIRTNFYKNVIETVRKTNLDDIFHFY